MEKTAEQLRREHIALEGDTHGKNKWAILFTVEFHIILCRKTPLEKLIGFVCVALCIYRCRTRSQIGRAHV